MREIRCPKRGCDAFLGNIHQIPREDYDMIVSEMKAAAAASA